MDRAALTWLAESVVANSVAGRVWNECGAREAKESASSKLKANLTVFFRRDINARTGIVSRVRRRKPPALAPQPNHAPNHRRCRHGHAHDGIGPQSPRSVAPSCVQLVCAAALVLFWILTVRLSCMQQLASTAGAGGLTPHLAHVPHAHNHALGPRARPHERCPAVPPMQRLPRLQVSTRLPNRSLHWP